MPFSSFRYSTFRQFNDDVKRFHIVHIASKVGSHTEGVFHPPLAVLMNLYAAVNVQSVAVDHLLRSWVYSQALVFLDDFLKLL